MSHNRIKIVFNSQAKSLSYQFQNEQMAWVPVSHFSALASRKYTETSIQQSATAILTIISTVYNPGNRGVEISFEGPDKDYDYLRRVVREKFSKENIICGQQAIKVAIAGKRGIGKTTLIETLAQKQGVRYEVTSKTGYKHYTKKSSPIEWFELEGIELGIDNIKKTERAVDELANQGLTMFIYCLSSIRVEQPEIQLIKHIKECHPEISLLAILTNAVSLEDTAAAEQIGKILGIKALPVMARDQKTRGGIIKAFGHESILRAVFGGT